MDGLDRCRRCGRLVPVETLWRGRCAGGCGGGGREGDVREGDAGLPDWAQTVAVYVSDLPPWSADGAVDGR